QDIRPRPQRLGLEAELLALAVEQPIGREHRRPLLAVDRKRCLGQAHQRVGRVASITARSPSTPVTRTVTTGGVCATGKGALMRAAVRASAGAFSLWSLATTFSW